MKGCCEQQQTSDRLAQKASQHKPTSKFSPFARYNSTQPSPSSNQPTSPTIQSPLTSVNINQSRPANSTKYPGFYRSHLLR
ncbi:hypothetical protein TWF225_004792 [Orbilia oligospora]|uniref:Uncharacterized protein n=1 Tax=Orbilia oligospora TaxID=2813651 RepID=A0A7C8TUV5_ORBOL|nr:hypothetical protein TWF751_000864 [Orbilia oligospora]KAF3186272.1 hypothetical protein TWF225_004792 [Orbilia oligospora]KAF3292994.1 hypothetical protein TWF132_004999 [Orbilia oligospora]TGJ73613.1 hypothetical protein EYR41_000699 [Orbilia oligospora]